MKSEREGCSKRNGRFPRSSERGPIEVLSAVGPRPENSFPRSSERGPIEVVVAAMLMIGGAISALIGARPH